MYLVPLKGLKQESNKYFVVLKRSLQSEDGLEGRVACRETHVGEGANELPEGWKSRVTKGQPCGHVGEVDADLLPVFLIWGESSSHPSLPPWTTVVSILPLHLCHHPRTVSLIPCPCLHGLGNQAELGFNTTALAQAAGTNTPDWASLRTDIYFLGFWMLRNPRSRCPGFGSPGDNAPWLSDRCLLACAQVVLVCSGRKKTLLSLPFL